MSQQSKQNVLVVGGTRGLGLEVAKKYKSMGCTVFATARDQTPSDRQGIQWLGGVDMSTESAGQTIVSQLPKDCRLDVVVIGAGQFHKESFDEPSWEGQLAMYKISAMGPVFVVHHLTKARLLHSGAKVVLVSSEAGSIGLRHPKEGGGMYGHHASKAALNMAGRLLALDLEKQGVIVSLVHPGFMRTEMTAGVGFDQFWDSGGAVHPDEAADSLVGFVKTLDMAKSGQLWAPRGPADIGTAEDTMEPKDQLSTPLRLPW